MQLFTEEEFDNQSKDCPFQKYHEVNNYHYCLRPDIGICEYKNCPFMYHLIKVFERLIKTFRP